MTFKRCRLLGYLARALGSIGWILGGLTAGCASSQPATPAAKFRVASQHLKAMGLEEVRQECEAPGVASERWFQEVEPLRERYTALACQRATIMGQRDWLARVPCDELKRRLWHDLPFLNDAPSSRYLRKSLWRCGMEATYFSRFDLEHLPASRRVEDAVAKALAGLERDGFKVRHALDHHLQSSADAFGKISLIGGFYAGFRGLGRWIAGQGQSACRDIARRLVRVMDADSRRSAQGYRGVNGVIHGLLDGRCFRGMSVLAAREIRIRVEQAVASDRTAELKRCRWLAKYGSPEGRDDMEAVMANPSYKAWIDRNSPSCLFALDKVTKPYSPPPTP